MSLSYHAAIVYVCLSDKKLLSAILLLIRMDNTTIFKDGEYIFSQLQTGNDPTGLTALQSILAPHVNFIEGVLWVTWVAVLLFVSYKLYTISTNNNS